MAKTTKKTTKKAVTKKASSEEDEFYNSLATSTGGTVLNDIEFDNFTDTGNLALNYICSGKFIAGGFPTGITEIYGPSGSAKTLIGNTALGATQRAGGYAIVEDCERSSNKDFARTAAHQDPKRVIIHTPLSIEQVERKIVATTNLIRKKFGPDVPISFLWDSISVTMCERETKEINIPEGASAAEIKKIIGGNEQPGERAKASGKVLRQLNPFLSDNNASLIIINQTRQSIGGYGNGEVTAGGGNALPFYCNARIRTSARMTIMDTKRDIPVGQHLNFANKKSRSCVPFLKAENVQLFFDRGINPVSGLLGSLINAGRIESTKAGWYTVLEPYAGGLTEGLTFQGSKERNDVSIDLICRFPALVDAENEEQVREYLAPYLGGIERSASTDIVSKAVTVDEGGYDEGEDDSDETLLAAMSELGPTDV